MEPTATQFTFKQTAADDSVGGGNVHTTTVASMYLFGGHGNSIIGNRFEDPPFAAKVDNTFRNIVIDNSANTAIERNNWAGGTHRQKAVIKIDGTTGPASTSARLHSNMGGGGTQGPNGAPVEVDNATGVISDNDMWGGGTAVFWGSAPQVNYCSMGGDNANNATGFLNCDYFKVMRHADWGNVTGADVMYLDGKHFSVSNKAPDTGTWSKGDFVFNGDPSSNGLFGWYASAGGTPGTWVPDSISGIADWNTMIHRPNSFTPSRHTHLKEDVTDFPVTWDWAAIGHKPSTFETSMPNRTRSCHIVIGADNKAALADADIAPQRARCFIDVAATVIQVQVEASPAG